MGSPEGGELEASDVDTSKYTKPEDAKRFVEETAWTPSPSPSARCTGLFKGTPKIDTERLDQIRELVKIPLVLHGGSGLPESEFRAAIEHGINKINFFTGLSLAASGAIDAEAEGVQRQDSLYRAHQRRARGVQGRRQRADADFRNASA